MASYSYIGCGPSSDKLNIIHIRGVGELYTEPFGIKTEKLVGTTETYCQ